MAYPTSIKSFTFKRNNIDKVVADDVNTAYTEITEIERQLGGFTTTSGGLAGVGVVKSDWGTGTFSTSISNWYSNDGLGARLKNIEAGLYAALVTGSASAAKLKTPITVNGTTGVDWSASSYTFTADAGTLTGTSLASNVTIGADKLTGTTLSSNVVTSSLTSIGRLNGLNVNGPAYISAGVQILPPTYSASAVAIEALPSQSANLVTIYGPSGLSYPNYLTIDKDGKLTVGQNTTFSNNIVVNGSSTFNSGVNNFPNGAGFGGLNTTSGSVVTLTSSTFLQGGRTSTTFTGTENGTAMSTSYLSVNRGGGIPLYINRTDLTGTQAAVQFYANATTVGVINITSGSAPAFASGSDYRIKTNVTPVTNALEKMKKAKVYTFNKTTDPENNLVTGFLAHELAMVQPDAVVGKKDAVDSSGNMVIQEVMEARLIPIMAQAIHDLIDLVESLGDRISKLEGK
jgi:hypothetical protein